jgi:hypothetical protein
LKVGASSIYPSPIIFLPTNMFSVPPILDTYIPIEVDETFLILELPTLKNSSNKTDEELFYNFSFFILNNFSKYILGSRGYNLIRRPYIETNPEIIKRKDQFGNIIDSSYRGNCTYKIPIPVGKLNLLFYYSLSSANYEYPQRYEFEMTTELPPAHSIYIKLNPNLDKQTYDIKPTPKGKFPCNPDGL